eukprot:130290-Hanusia_phi.AAC.2
MPANADAVVRPVDDEGQVSSPRRALPRRQSRALQLLGEVRSEHRVRRPGHWILRDAIPGREVTGDEIIGFAAAQQADHDAADFQVGQESGLVNRKERRGGRDEEILQVPLRKAERVHLHEQLLCPRTNRHLPHMMQAVSRPEAESSDPLHAALGLLRDMHRLVARQLEFDLTISAHVGSQLAT